MVIIIYSCTAWGERLYTFFRVGCTLAYQIWAHTAMFLHGSRYSYLHFLSQGGMTALMVASYTGHSSVVRALLQAGPAINTTNQVRYSACQTLPQCGFYLQWNCVYKGQGDRLEWHLKENPPYSFVCGKLQVHIDVLYSTVCVLACRCQYWSSSNHPRDFSNVTLLHPWTSCIWDVSDHSPTHIHTELHSDGENCPPCCSRRRSWRYCSTTSGGKHWPRPTRQGKSCDVDCIQSLSPVKWCEVTLLQCSKISHKKKKAVHGLIDLTVSNDYP